MPLTDRSRLQAVIKIILEEQQLFLSRINEVICENKTLDGLHMDMVNCPEASDLHSRVRVSHCRTIAAQHKLLKKHRRISKRCFQVAERERSNRMTSEEILLEIEGMERLLERIRSEQAQMLREREHILAEHREVFKEPGNLIKEK